MRPRARLINLIGEELISDEPVAVVELVKNAYDADAKTVSVSFSGSPGETPLSIVVADDGAGMDLETVLNAWLEPGTTHKKRLDRSPGGRPYQGAKGIGRFASARLGRNLLLETKQQGSDDAVFVLLDWGAFTDDDYLEDIDVEYESRLAEDLPIGTRLTIEKIRDGTWNEDAYERLHARLSRLISPFEDIDDFAILLEIPGQPHLSGIVEPPKLLLKPRYSLNAVIDEAGRLTGTVVVDGESISIDRSLARGAESPACGAFELEVRAWDRDREGLEPIATRENMAVSQIRKTLDAYCGVSIYRDGFRVHPYGERGNDWLNLDLRSRQNPVRNLANNQIIGAVRISRDGNPDLRDRSTREGMVKNEAHEALEDWFKRAVTLLEENRYRVRPRQESRVRGDQLFEAFDLRSAVREAESALGATHPVAKLIANTEKQISEGVEQVQEVFSRLLMSAGLGHMVDIVIHEIGAPLGKVNRQLSILERDLTKLLYNSDMPKIRPQFEAMRSWLDQIHGLRQRLDPQTPAKRGRTSAFDVAGEVEVTLELYAGMTAKQGVKVRFKKPAKEVRARMSKAALSQVVANLVDNALFWIVQKHGSGGGGELEVTLALIEGGFSVIVCDDGQGVPEDQRATIFEPYFSTKPNGIGLGLYIARLVIEPYGRLVYRDDCELSGAGFEARFEKGTGL
jgi:signal transduction histidine kinase